MSRCEWPYTYRPTPESEHYFRLFCVRPLNHRGPHRGEFYFGDDGPLTEDARAEDLIDPAPVSRLVSTDQQKGGE